VTEWILRCPTSVGVVERLVELEDDCVYVSAPKDHARPCSHPFLSQLSGADLTALPRELFCMRNTTNLWLNVNTLCALPRDIAQLKKLQRLSLFRNQLKSLPAEIGQLTNLVELHVGDNLLQWLPVEASQLAKLSKLMLTGNPLPAIAGLAYTDESAAQCARRFDEIFAATTHVGFIRERATEICIGLQDLELPALITLEIIDEAVHGTRTRFACGPSGS
jgi:hypothetical protein